MLSGTHSRVTRLLRPIFGICAEKSVFAFVHLHLFVQTIDEGTGIRVFRLEPHSVRSANFVLNV